MDPTARQEEMSLVKLNKIPRHNGVNCQVFVKPAFTTPKNGGIYDKLAAELVTKAENDGVLTRTGGGPSIVFGPDPEFCYALLKVCNKRGYTNGFTALIPTTLNNARLESGLVKHGAKIQKVETDDGNPQAGADAIVQKAKDTSTPTQGDPSNVTNTSVNLISFFQDPLIQSAIVDTVAEAIANEIVTAVNAIPEVDRPCPGIFVGEKDPFGVTLKVGEKFRSTFQSCRIYEAVPDSMLSHNKLQSLVYSTSKGEDVDKVIVTCEEATFRMARDLNRKEDIYCGERSGAVVEAALKVAKNEALVAICLLPDSAAHCHRRYLDVDHMRGKGYMSEGEFGSLYWWYLLGVGNITFNTFVSVEDSCRVNRASELMAKDPSDKLLVWKTTNAESRDLGDVAGILTRDVIEKMETETFQKGEGATLGDLSEHLEPFLTLSCRDKLGELDKALDSTPNVILYNDVHEYKGAEGEVTCTKTPIALVSTKEVNAWVYSVEEHHRTQYGWEPGMGYEENVVGNKNENVIIMNVNAKNEETTSKNENAKNENAN